MPPPAVGIAETSLFSAALAPGLPDDLGRYSAKTGSVHPERPVPSDPPDDLASISAGWSDLSVADKISVDAPADLANIVNLPKKPPRP